jgi:Holliday junction resolvasome RuvABC endonuclease subunit
MGDVAVFGVDLSFVRTGMALADGRVGSITSSAHTPGGLYALEARCFAIRDSIIAKIERAAPGDGAVLVVLEDLPPARAHEVSHLGILHGIVRVGLLEAAFDYATPTPSQVKKYATGNGRAKKPDLRVELVRRTHGRLDIRDDNECDAWWLRAMGLQALGVPPLDLPKLHLEPIAKIAWPVFTDDDEQRATLG